ncbi:hypothetical protein QBC35DRAFT_103517 [Podospora australis]|uniref:Uncharacterized protein n=1 Tax=Podospora australis TaxID=1536484 RepID=A0AAN7AN91_9PEZI|nr:hypothetical protein QBC35DRAFT_103517 [Podospora australis]
MARGTMPSVAQETSPTQSSSSSSCKKRRREDLDHHQLPFNPHSRHIFPDNIVLDGNQEFQHHASSPLTTRKLLPLPLSKRQRTSLDSQITKSPVSRGGEEPAAASKHRSATSPAPTPAAQQPVMSRCYICFRKPTKKTDLDSFADCQGCGQRTCFVCMRQCLGWGPSDLPSSTFPSSFMQTETSFTMLDADDTSASDFNFGKPGPKEEENGWTGGGHRQMVCSRCCVEKGADGDVVCLGCLPFVEG